MKLTRYQINAIIDEIRSQEKKEVAQGLSKIRKQYSPNAKILATKYHKSLQHIPADVRELLNIEFYSIGAIQERLLKRIVPKARVVSFDDLRRKIILASIDSSTVEELKRKLNIKF
jgi:uncharacterized pyridoxal phosphate-containing UPF0001 family protein